ncbi:hypothetical protein H0H92_005041 [Tricholoma furcatifolium]|nr:hypothetical protein H0H92_005041 [Tricholoma furcatifolium]
MPHALFLGSSLASQNRVSPNGDQVLSLPSAPRRPRPTTLKARATELFAPLFRVTRAERVAAVRDLRTRYGEHENNRLAFVRQHLGHSITDIVSSLLFIAIPINSAILIVSATVFYADPNGHLSTQNSAGLFNAHDLIKAHIGSGAATVFAVALVCAGQTSSITATLSGQIVSEGFLDWRISPFLRRLVTRLISLIPATVVAAAVGREGINALLVASQVTLSVVLPFIAFPLLYLTSSKAVMRIRKPLVSASALAQDGAVDGAPHPDAGAAAGAEVPSSSEEGDNRPMAEKVELEASAGSEETIDYSNGWVFTIVAYFIWVVVVAANVYAIVSLGLN